MGSERNILSNQLSWPRTASSETLIDSQSQRSVLPTPIFLNNSAAKSHNEDESDTESANEDAFVKAQPDIVPFKIRNYHLKMFLSALLVSALIVLPMYLMYSFNTSTNNQLYFYLSIAFAIFSVGYVIFDFLVHQFVKLMLSIPFLSKSNLLYYIREFHSLISFLLWDSAGLIIIATVREKTLETIESNDYLKNFLILLLVFGVMKLIQKQFVVSLAINFNSVNFIPAVKNALNLDRIIRDLHTRSKSSYKFNVKTKRAFLHISRSANLKRSTSIETDVKTVNPSPPESKNNEPTKLSAIKVGKLIHEFFELVSRDKRKYDPTQQSSNKKISMAALHLSKHLVKWIKVDSKSGITLEDLKVFLSEEDAIAFITHCANSATICDLYQSDIESGLFRAYKDRHSLARNLTTMRSAVHKVDQILSGVVLVLAVIVGTLIFGFAFKDIMVFHSTFILGSSFMIGNSAKTTFESIVFLFVAHPYDIGDRIYLPINESSENYHNLLVTDIHLNTTEFIRNDGMKVYMPNDVLSKKMIINVRRSGKTYENHVFKVPFGTPAQKLDQVQRRIEEYLSEHRKDYTRHLQIVTKLKDGGKKLQVEVTLQQTSNFQNNSEIQDRQTEFTEFLRLTLQELALVPGDPLEKVTLVSA